jgi:Uma2 family endonuclease
VNFLLTFPPKIVVEILSPSTATKDLNVKTIIYAAEGIPYYLIVHPDEEWVRVLKLENGEWVIAFEGKEGGFTFDLGHCQVQADFGRIWHN